MNPNYIHKITVSTASINYWCYAQTKKINIKKLFLVASVLFFTLSLSALNTYTTLSGSFDDGSGTAPYTNNFTGTYLIQPAGAVKVNLCFTSFNTESNYDKVYVYDGNSETAPLIGTYHNSNLPPLQIISSGNSLFIKFTTDSSVALDGWTVQYGGILSGSGTTTVPPLYPPNDASVVYSTVPGNEYQAATNYGTRTTILAEAGTSSGYIYTYRCYIGLRPPPFRPMPMLPVPDYTFSATGNRKIPPPWDQVTRAMPAGFSEQPSPGPKPASPGTRCLRQPRSTRYPWPPRPSFHRTTVPISPPL